MCEVCDSVLRVTHDLSNLDAILFIHVCDVTSPNVRHRSYTRVKYDLSICATWLIHMCEIWLFICVKCVTLSYVRHMTDPIWMRHDSFLHVIWLIHTCIITHSHVWNLTYMCEIRRIYFYDMRHSCIRETWLIHLCDMSHPYGASSGLGGPLPTMILPKRPPLHDLSRGILCRLNS